MKKVLIIHRYYRHKGGEDFFLEKSLIPALEQIGAPFEVLTYTPLGSNFLTDLLETLFMVLGFEKLRPSYFRVHRELKKGSYDVVMLNNWIPTLSLAIPELIKKKGLKVYSWVHNSRISCANGLKFDGKASCHRCWEKGSHWAAIKNCHQSRAQSTLYALVYRFKRVAKIVGRHVDMFLPVSEFAGQNVSESLKGIIGKVPKVQSINPSVEMKEGSSASGIYEKLPSEFFLFVGRLSYEKGADLFLDLAIKYPRSKFVMAGGGPMEALIRRTLLPNLIYLGPVEHRVLKGLYKRATALVMPSRVPENAPMVIVESEFCRLPIIYPKLGGAKELVTKLNRRGCSFDEFDPMTFSSKPDPHPSQPLWENFKVNIQSVINPL